MRTKIYAHRGASGYAPENTMPAFELALQMKADGIETDVQLTKDGIPVLIHDEKLRRTTGAPGYVKDLTLEEIKQLDAGRWFSSSFTEAKIPTLEEFLQWIKPTPLLLNMELKTDKIAYKNIEQKVYDLVVSYGLLERTVFSSFNARSMEQIRKIDKTVDVAFLTSKRIRRLEHFVKSIGATSIHAKYRLLNTDFVNECKRNLLALRVYTVNKPFHIFKCYQLGCTGIFTDVPDVAYKLRENMPSFQKIRNPFRRK